jgi:glycosyltransferase involved in cell wall biosynthesis
MNVLLLSTYDTYGGAGIAARRTMQALRRAGVEARLLVQQRESDEPFVQSIADTWWEKKRAFARFALERARFVPHERDASVRFQFSPANVGTDISRHPLVQAADVLHLHWVNFGFLSIRSLQSLFALGKPVVWTLHDQWAFTGGCHYAGTCRGFEQHCGNCPLLKRPDPRDLSRRVWERKARAFAGAPLHVTTCSDWLAREARRSSLFREVPVTPIPNPIDPDDFKPVPQAEACQYLGLNSDCTYLLFAAQKISDPRKGFRYVREALERLKAEGFSAKKPMELLVFGKADAAEFGALPYPVRALGTLRTAEQLRAAYAAAAAFLIPSLEDNLPNTLMEALACGTPGVGFRTGGIPELIVHRQTGYVAEHASAEDLARGIRWVLTETPPDALRRAARHHVLSHYAEAVVAGRYRQVYETILNLTSR